MFTDKSECLPYRPASKYKTLDGGCSLVEFGTSNLILSCFFTSCFACHSVRTTCLHTHVCVSVSWHKPVNALSFIKWYCPSVRGRLFIIKLFHSNLIFLHKMEWDLMCAYGCPLCGLQKSKCSGLRALLRVCVRVCVVVCIMGLYCTIILMSVTNWAL